MIVRMGLVKGFKVFESLVSKDSGSIPTVCGFLLGQFTL